MSSRTHFEVLGLDLNGKVLGLGLQAYKSSKMFCLQSRTALFFDLQKMGQGFDLFVLLRLAERARDIAVNLFFVLLAVKTLQ